MWALRALMGAWSMYIIIINVTPSYVGTGHYMTRVTSQLVLAVEFNAKPSNVRTGHRKPGRPGGSIER